MLKFFAYSYQCVVGGEDEEEEEEEEEEKGLSMVRCNLSFSCDFNPC